jgi:hypothetical protein
MQYCCSTRTKYLNKKIKIFLKIINRTKVIAFWDILYIYINLRNNENKIKEKII